MALLVVLPFLFFRLPHLSVMHSAFMSHGIVGHYIGSADPGMARQMMQSHSNFATKQLQQQQQQQQHSSRPSGSLPAAVVSQQQLGLAHPDAPQQPGSELETILSEAHAAYRTGEFTRALQLCQTVSP